MIVAWHEVPGKLAERIRPVGYGMISVLNRIRSSRPNQISYGARVFFSVGRSTSNTLDHSFASHRTLRDGIRGRLYPGTSCQVAFADYGAPEARDLHDQTLRSRRRPCGVGLLSFSPSGTGSVRVLGIRANISFHRILSHSKSRRTFFVLSLVSRKRVRSGRE
jgi:hypothetical protein